MTKEQFWRIIEDVNAVSQNHDQETVWTRIVENLSHYPLEDIMDWHLIYHEYKDAAYRDEMFAVSTALGSDYADEGLNNFRAWLISCGKEVFMNALREPVTLVDSPKKDGCFNYGKYDYAAFYAYNAKMFRIDPDSTQDLIYALEDYTLDRETIEDIHEELPKQQGFGQNGVGASFANYYSPNCGKNNAPQSDAIQALMDSGEVVHAYVYSVPDQGNRRVEYAEKKEIMDKIVEKYRPDLLHPPMPSDDDGGAYGGQRQVMADPEAQGGGRAPGRERARDGGVSVQTSPRNRRMPEPPVTGKTAEVKSDGQA